jgi:Arc/MetJ-type ribon-helix-helix transcriptional regulator
MLSTWGRTARGKASADTLVVPEMRQLLQDAVSAGEYPDVQSALDDALNLWREARAARQEGASRECLEMCGRDNRLAAPFDAMKARLVALHAETLAAEPVAGQR